MSIKQYIYLKTIYSYIYKKRFKIRLNFFLTLRNGCDIRSVRSGNMATCAYHSHLSVF